MLPTQYFALQLLGDDLLDHTRQFDRLEDQLESLQGWSQQVSTIWRDSYKAY